MTKRQSKLLIFMCWALYVVAYLGRYSYKANVLPISNFYKVSDTEIGLVSSCFFFAYGAGQIINGILCKYYNLKHMLPLSVILSSIINVILFLGVLPFKYFKYMWLLNGASQSILWSSLLLVLSRNLDEKYIKKSIIVMATTVSTGTFIAYGLSALFALKDGFRFAFLVAAVAMAVAGIIWVFIYDKMTVKEKPVVETKETEKVPLTRKTDKSVIKILIILKIVHFNFY